VLLVIARLHGLQSVQHNVGIAILSVCLSITLRYAVKMAKRIDEPLSLPSIPIVLVFCELDRVLDF